MDWKEVFLATTLFLGVIALKWLLIASAIFVPLWLVFC